MAQKALGFVNPLGSDMARDICGEIRAIKEQAQALHLELVDILGWATLNGPVTDTSQIRDADVVKKCVKQFNAYFLIVSTGNGVVTFNVDPPSGCLLNPRSDKQM